MCLTGGSAGAAKIPFNPKPKFGSPMVRRETSLNLLVFPAVPSATSLTAFGDHKRTLANHRPA
jgi:hypothetical protein